MTVDAKDGFAPEYLRWVDGCFEGSRLFWRRNPDGSIMRDPHDGSPVVDLDAQVVASLAEQRGRDRAIASRSLRWFAVGLLIFILTMSWLMSG